MKALVLALLVVVAIVHEPVLAAVGTDCTNDASVCTVADSTICLVDPADPSKKKCASNACANGDCKHGGACGANSKLPCVCTAAIGYTGTKCETEKCGSAPCTGNQVCVDPSSGEKCVADPCTSTPCGANGDCSYDNTLADPKPVCTCKNGFGGDTCTDKNGVTPAPTTAGCTPPCTKPQVCDDSINVPACKDAPACTSPACTSSQTCKYVNGTASCKENGGNIVAVAPGLLLALLLSAIYL